MGVKNLASLFYDIIKFQIPLAPFPKEEGESLSTILGERLGEGGNYSHKGEQRGKVSNSPLERG